MYEDVGKKQVHQFTAALRGCRTMLQAAAYFESCLSDLNSTRLRDLLAPGELTKSTCILLNSIASSKYLI